MTTEETKSLTDVQVLQECCKWNSPVVLMLSDDSIRLEGRFHRVIEEAKVVQLCITSFGRLKTLGDIRLGQYCGVTFVHRDRPYFFLGTLSDNFTEDDEPIVEFPLAVVVRAEMRRTYRVPVLDDCVTAEAFGEESETAFRPRVLNVSLTGALIEVDLQDDPGLLNFDKVGLTLRFRDEFEISLRGIVRRRDTSAGVKRYGLLFPETAGAKNPPEALVKITRHVERLWLGRDDKSRA